MKLIPAEQLFSHVIYTGDAFCFMVESRSGDLPHRVDMEARGGLGKCDCWSFRGHYNYNCWHISEVRAFMVCKAIQERIIGNQALKENGGKVDTTKTTG